MADLSSVLQDLTDEGDHLDVLVRDLRAQEWALPTPAENWTIAHQIAHLAWTDEVALLTSRAAAGDDDAAARFDDALARAAQDPAGFVDAAAEAGADADPDELLRFWRSTRTDLADALDRVPAGVKIAWFGPPMSALSMATARLMETWAHGRDVAAALGVIPQPTDRLRHIAHLGVRTRDFAYAVRSETAPAAEFRVSLTAPSGRIWEWGPPDAEQTVTGSAEDFCLLTTQRIHRDDTDLMAVGHDAAHWLTIAQAFAGLPGAGRPEAGRGAAGRPEAGRGVAGRPEAGRDASGVGAAT